MKTRNEAIRKHLTDMVSVESHILEAIQRQLKDVEDLQRPDVADLLARIEKKLSLHKSTLERTAQAYGGGAQQGIKKAVTEVLGMVAGLYDDLRQHKLSRMLRDDYTALHLAAISYGMLHTFGLAVREPQIASMAQDHLEDLTPLLLEITRMLPGVVVQESQEENEFEIDTTVADDAVRNIRQAWSEPVVSG